MAARALRDRLVEVLRSGCLFVLLVLIVYFDLNSGGSQIMKYESYDQVFLLVDKALILPISLARYHC